MKCPICSTNNPHEARFCVSCGIPLGPQGELSPRAERRHGFAPLGISGLLEETFTVYRRNLWPFVLITLVPQVPILFLSLAILALSPDPALGSWIGIAALSLVSGVLYSLAGGASVFAVSQQYLQTRVDVRYCFGKAWLRVVTLVLANLVNGLALLGAWVLIRVLVGVPLFFYLVVIWFFFVECIMMENTGPMGALWRSRDLVRGSYWRVFRIGVVYMVPTLAILMLVGSLTLIVANFSPVMANIASAAVSVVLFPVISIGRTLVYLDLRVRKEQYTMDELAREMGV